MLDNVDREWIRGELRTAQERTIEAVRGMQTEILTGLERFARIEWIAAKIHRRAQGLTGTDEIEAKLANAAIELREFAAELDELGKSSEESKP